MKNILYILLLCLLFNTTNFAQVKPIKQVLKPIQSDCQQAVSITINTGSYYGPTIPPEGFGTLQEIKSSTGKLFDEEHNTAWYKLNIARNGELVIDIIPADTTNDYDFALYSYSDSSFCDAIKTNKTKPVRSNLSNLKKSHGGVTGIKNGQKDTLIGKGPGEPFSKSIQVKKGEKYMLILDNVTPNGLGHTLFFNYVREVEIKGKVLGADSIPVVADITLSDNKGNIILETKSNTRGDYEIKTEMNENQNYSLTYYSDNTFAQTAVINTKDLKKSNTFPDIKTVLPLLKKGEKYKLGNINFIGNMALLVPESGPSVVALYKLMQKNKGMHIEIQGHVNDSSTKRTTSEELFDQQLSEARAKAIYDFLKNKGTNTERMIFKGYSNTQMLFPHPSSEYEGKANRRVEIKVISLE